MSETTRGSPEPGAMLLSSEACLWGGSRGQGPGSSREDKEDGKEHASEDGSMAPDPGDSEPGAATRGRAHACRSAAATNSRFGHLVIRHWSLVIQSSFEFRHSSFSARSV